MTARRSERFVAREQRELRRELLDLALPGARARRDGRAERPGAEPRASRTAAWSRWTAAAAADFDVIDRFVARYGLDLDVAAEARAAHRRRDRAPARRRRRPARRPRPPLARADARAARAHRLAARPGRADVRAQEAPRAAGAGEPGARHEPEGEPGAARRRRGRGGRARLRRARDDGRRLPLRAAERDRDPRRLADRAARA